MLKYLNTKEINTNFSFTFAISGRGQTASKEIFCYGRNFFLTVRSAFNRFLLGYREKSSTLEVCILNPPLIKIHHY